MELYHGTSIKHLESIKERGLLPRSYTGISNYKHNISNKDFVYLTNCFAMDRALKAIKDREDAVIFRVIPNLYSLYPDDDYVRYKYYIRYNNINIREWKDEWMLSLESYGLTAHLGPIEYIDYVVIPYEELINTVDTYYNPGLMSVEIRANCNKNLKTRFNGL